LEAKVQLSRSHAARRKPSCQINFMAGEHPAKAKRPTYFAWAPAVPWAEVAGEWLVAAWLLAGAAPFWARRVALAVLFFFVAASGWRLVSGLADCGCVGRVSMHPAWTVAVDLLTAEARDSDYSGFRRKTGVVTMAMASDQRGTTLLQEPPDGGVAFQSDRDFIRAGRFVIGAGPGQQFGACGPIGLVFEEP
jgi:hypothetical protein